MMKQHVLLQGEINILEECAKSLYEAAGEVRPDEREQLHLLVSDLNDVIESMWSFAHQTSSKRAAGTA